MRYSIDTNIVIAAMEGRNPAVRQRIAACSRGDVAISSIVMHELAFGAYNSARIDANLRRLALLAFPVIELDEKDARAAGQIRAALKRAATPIGPYDLLIAGQALARGLTFVTANVREFGRIQGLNLENWTV